MSPASGSVADGVAARGSAVGVGAGGDGGVDRRLSGGGRPEAVELRRGDDVGPVEPLGDSRHRAGFGWRTVGLAALGAGVTVGDAAGGGDGAGLGGARGRGGGVVHPQASGSGAVWLVAVGYAVACQIPIYLMRSSRFTALELAQTLRYLPDLVVVLALLLAVGLCAPNRDAIDVVGCVAGADGGNAVRHSGIRCEQPVLDRDVPDQLARQPGATVSAERAGRARRGARRLECTAARPGGRSVGVAACGVAGEPGQPHVRAAARPARIRRRTTDLRMLDVSGHVVDAKVTWVRSIVAGPAPQCGYLVQPDFPVSDAARRPAAAGGLDGGDQLPRQQRRLDDDVAVGGHARRRCRCGPDSTVSSCGCRGPVMRSTCGRTPLRCRCASRRGRGFVAPR